MYPKILILFEPIRFFIRGKRSGVTLYEGLPFFIDCHHDLREAQLIGDPPCRIKSEWPPHGAAVTLNKMSIIRVPASFLTKKI